MSAILTLFASGGLGTSLRGQSDRLSACKRVLRGGSFNNEPRNLRSANRNRNEPEDRNRNLGLRLSAGQELQAAEPQGAERPLPERRSRARRAGGSEPA